MITLVPPFPLRSQGLAQQAYSAGVEASLSALPQAIIDINDLGTAYNLATKGTSVTSNTIGTGAKTFTTQTGLGFVTGMAIRVANSGVNYITADVTSYNSGTGSLVINGTAVSGSGTFTSWTISLAAVGANSAGSISFTPAGNIAASNVQAAIQELDTEKMSTAPTTITTTGNITSNQGSAAVNTLALTNASGVSLSINANANTDANIKTTTNHPLTLSTNNINRLSISNIGTFSAVIPNGSTLYRAYMCRGWVNFNGTGTVAIRASGNVSSVTDNGTGDYTINFIDVLPDADYATIGNASPITAILAAGVLTAVSSVTTGVRVIISDNNTDTAGDYPSISVAVFR